MGSCVRREGGDGEEGNSGIQLFRAVGGAAHELERACRAV